MAELGADPGYDVVLQRDLEAAEQRISDLESAVRELTRELARTNTALDQHKRIDH
jgi:hypothetical protein